MAPLYANFLTQYCISIFVYSLINCDQRFLKWKINPKQKSPWLFWDLSVGSPSFYPNPLHSGVETSILQYTTVYNGRLDAFHWNVYLISIFDSRLNEYHDYYYSLSIGFQPEKGLKTTLCVTKIRGSVHEQKRPRSLQIKTFTLIL